MMPSPTVSICKFVGTISLGLLTGVSASLSSLTLPSLLTLPTAITARSTLRYLSTNAKLYSSYLRHTTTLALLSAFWLSPRRSRHPYLLYTTFLAIFSGSGVDYALTWAQGKSQERMLIEAEAEGDNINGEQARQSVERMQFAESVRAAVAGLGFAMGVVGIWGDGL